MATTDRAVSALPGLDDGVPGGDQPASRRGGWWWDWFAPARRLRPRPPDVLVALATAFVQIAGTIVYSQDEPPSPWAFDAFACMLLAAGPVALLFRRRWPDATLAVAFAAAAGYAAGGYPRGPAGLPAFVLAMVSAIMMGRRAFAWGVLAVAYAAFIWLPSLLPDAVEEADGRAGRDAGARRGGGGGGRRPPGPPSRPHGRAGRHRHGVTPGLSSWVDKPGAVNLR